MFDIWTTTESRVFGIGDIHGKWQTIRDFWINHKLKEKFTEDSKDKNIIVLFGDAGLNYFFNQRDEETKEKLNNFPFTYFVIRGNHEERPSICAERNPDKWHTEEFWDNTVYVENAYPNIKYALDEIAIYKIPYITGYCDGTKENDYNDEGMPFWDFYSALVIPGAYSIDKYYRLANNWSWFESEQLTEEERTRGWELIKQLKSVDLVFSHTCPCMFEPTDLFLPNVDQSLVDKTMERYLGQIEYVLDYKLWCFGHFHSTRVYPKRQSSQMLMLYNTAVIDISKYLKTQEVLKFYKI